jgi:hypothetical protein
MIGMSKQMKFVGGHNQNSSSNPSARRRAPPYALPSLESFGSKRSWWSGARVDKLLSWLCRGVIQVGGAWILSPRCPMFWLVVSGLIVMRVRFWASACALFVIVRSVYQRSSLLWGDTLRALVFLAMSIAKRIWPAILIDSKFSTKLHTA